MLDTIYQTNCQSGPLINDNNCLAPQYPNDLGGRLGISALPDVFKWQTLVDLFVLLGLMLVVKGIFYLVGSCGPRTFLEPSSRTIARMHAPCAMRREQCV